MSFTNKPSVALTLDQVMEIVDQLSPADTLKVAKHIKKKNKDADLDDLIAIFSKVKMSDGRIDAAVTRGPSGLRFVVRDHGPGLPDGELARVFEPFFTRRTHGTGLGLAVCKRLVELHGGTLTATNPDGGGAAFTIDLPKAVR